MSPIWFRANANTKEGAINEARAYIEKKLALELVGSRGPLLERVAGWQVENWDWPKVSIFLAGSLNNNNMLLYRNIRLEPNQALLRTIEIIPEGPIAGLWGAKAKLTDAEYKLLTTLGEEWPVMSSDIVCPSANAKTLVWTKIVSGLWHRFYLHNFYSFQKKKHCKNCECCPVSQLIVR